MRRVTRQMLFALKNAEWDEEPMKLFADALSATIFQTNKCPKGLIMHFCDFYVEEIAKVADGDLSEDRAHAFFEPFLLYYTKLNDQVLLQQVEHAIFNQLLIQSELGQEYQEKFDIWKQANFPTRSIDDIEVKYKVRGNKSQDDDDLSDGESEDLDEERPLDPRAGRVDVILREIKFDALKIAETMENFRYKAFATSKSRKGLARLAGKFRKFSEDIFPLGIKTMPQEHDAEDSAIDLDLKAMELAEFEKKLALGDVDSEGSDFDEDLDNRKHGKLKRKSKDGVKTKEKKQKLSKLHSERFFNATEDFTKAQQEDEDDETEQTAAPEEELKIKKKKIETTSETEPRKIKVKKRKSLPASLKLSSTTTSDDDAPKKHANNNEDEATTEKPKKAIKVNKDSSPSSSGSSQPFEVTDDWSEPLKDGEVEFFVPSRKQKLKALQNLANDDSDKLLGSNLVLNPFAKKTGSVKKIKSNDAKTPRIQLTETSTGSSGKRVIIALNKNKAQSPHEYIKQVKDSPNVPFDSNKKPSKSLLKPNVIPSPINPFYQKKIGLKLNFNDTM